jgi:large repetitive protein
MSVGAQLDSFEALAKALGILNDAGSANDKWFADPVGTSTNDHGLKEILADDTQRDALLTFVDEVLGAPDKSTRGGATWVPLFKETAPPVTIFAVVKPVAGAVYIGVGLEHTMTGAAPKVATRVHVPIFRVQRGTTPLTSAGSLPPWLLLGRPDGRIEIALDLTLRDSTPRAGEASLGALGVTLGIPTDGSANLHLALELRALQLPGATSTRTLTLDASNPGELGAEVLDLLATLVRAQVDALGNVLPAEVAGLLGLLGLSDVTDLPALPLADLPVRGINALVEWLRSVFASTAARTAWFSQLRKIVGGTIDAGAQSVSSTVGPLTFTVGVRTTTGAGGALVVIPSLALSLNTAPGARVQLAIDLLRADLGTGAVTAVPDLRAEALFGDQAGGAPLLTGNPSVGGLRTGLVLRADRRPAFSLTLHNVNGQPVLDISSPQAAMSAVDTVVSSALDSAMTNFGAAGALIGKLLGIRAPAGVTGVSSVKLLADPLKEMTRYWRDLTAAAPAMADVLGAFRALVASVPAASVPGSGTKIAPWRVELTAPLILLVWRDGDALVIDAALDIATPVFGDHIVTTTLRASLLRLAFTPVQVTFVGTVSATVELRRAVGAMELGVGGLQLTADALRAIVQWSPSLGLLLDIEAPQSLATITLPSATTEFALPIPVRDVNGNFTLPAELWPDAQSLIVALAAQAEITILDESLSLIGWTGTGPELALSTLVAGDPALAIRLWLADLVLDCDRVREALGVLARLLSAGRLRAPLGSGSAKNPYRCPIAGNVRAPALTAWLIPPCPPRMDFGKVIPGVRSNDRPEDGDSLVARLQNAALQLPDVRDLLTGRDSLGLGFEQLITRIVDTDGVLVVPTTVPDGVAVIRRDGSSYDDMLAAGASGLLAPQILAAMPATIVHVGCDEVWRTDRPAGRAVDATGATATGAITAAGTGEWFVMLPTPAAARAFRPDHDALAEMSDRLVRALAARTTPVTIIAYGACGAAAIRVASANTQISEVVTVGAPWAAPSVNAFRTGLGADALRVLERLLRTDVALLPAVQRAVTATPLDVMRDVVLRALEIARDDGTLPSAGAEPRRSGLLCKAVFGALDDETVRTGFASVLDDGIAARFETLRDASPDPVLRSALHVGVDVPVLAASVGGVRVGFGATFDLAALERDEVNGVRVSVARGVTVHLELGITDGWLIGGPSPEPGDVDVRWMAANVVVPFDGTAGDSELVLYEATGLGAFRERWVVRADGDGISATQALPEVRAILSAVVARLRVASPELGTLLDVLGLVRDGGLDAAGLDRLLFEPKLLAERVRARASDLAASLRALVTGMGGTAGSMTWTVGDATLALDVAARTFSVNIATTLGGVAPCTLGAALTADGRATADVAIGALDTNAGGVRLVGRAGAMNNLAVEWSAPGPTPTRTMALLPVPDVAAFTGFASTVVPAFLMQALARALRDRAQPPARAAIESALDALALLKAADADGQRAIRLPIALFDDAAAFLMHGAESWRSDPVGGAVRLLDAVAPIVAPARGSATGWPIVPGVTVNYTGAGGRLALTLDATLAGNVGVAAIATRLLGGVRISNDGRVEPILDTAVTIDGTGLQLSVSPNVQLAVVRPAPAPLLPIFPAGAGVGALLKSVGETVLPPVLNALAAKRNDVGVSLVKDVGLAVFDLGGALDLRDGNNFTSGKLTAFAADPASRLLARLPDLVGLGMATLARALDPGATLVSVVPPTAGKITLVFGTAPHQIKLTLDTSGVTPVLRFAGLLAVPAIGNIAIEELRLAADGVGIAVRVGPAPLLIGGVTLRPVLSVRAGVTATGVTRMAALGMALNDAGTKAVELRWALNNTAPALVLVTRGVTDIVDTDAGHVAIALLSVAAGIASGIALPTLLPVLPPQAIAGLEKVLFVTVGANTSLDTTLFDDLLQPERLFTRLKRLAWNLATLPIPLSVTIDGVVKISLVAQPGVGSAKLLGVALTLGGTGKLILSNGDPVVAIEADPTWIEGASVPAGITITLLEGTVTPTDVTLELKPGFTIGGVGLRFTKTGGPLLNLGPVGLDGIAVHVFAEMSSLGVGGGVQLELAGLAIAPAGGGGNPVAGGILKDAARGGANNRPAFSPGIAVQKRAGGNVGVSVRAGPPPGPWWLVIQRQLGPLYLERIGFDSRSDSGTITRLQLLFDGKVSIFGMTGAVDQLSLTWNGGDVFDATRWNADLMGLAISADMSGVTLAGGLLKDSSGGYLGMLLGRFGVYGLTVYGGYAVLDGNPSFFIFGAINGPIGGPPAFFITGIGAGLGINRQLRVPDDLSHFGDYPFIKALDVSASVSDPMVELRKLNDYFKPQLGQFWVAAGISFTSFALVDGIAVVAVAFGSDGLDINLLGLARLALPRPQVALISIELALLARFSTREGLFSIRAQLTENSWLLYPEVRLTGGFAFVVWWKGPLRGQFVLTIGGYHPRFHRDGYPEVPRVGLMWHVSDAIVVKGGAYFALTSEALMAGIEVTVSADFGWAWARIEFGANGIVYFDPFWFEVEAYARISAGVSIDTFFGEISFSISTSATLNVHGPDFGGRATFSVGPCSVSVAFGSDTQRKGDQLEWAAFVTKYLEDGVGGGARALSSITGLGLLTRKAGANKGESADGSAERPYEVFAEFQIAIASTIPISDVRLGPSNTLLSVTPKRPDNATTTLGLSPMGKGAMNSVLTLNIVGTSGEPNVMGNHAGVLDGEVDRIGLDTEAFPIGVWGEPNVLPIPAIPNGDVIFALNRLRFDLRKVVGTSPLPPIPFGKVEHARDVLPLQALGGQRVVLFTTVTGLVIPAPTTVAASMLEASTRLFATRADKAVDGLLARGNPGAVAAAAFHGDRVSPPIFGTLADGLRRTNAADGASSTLPIAPAAVPPGPRPPKLAGVLAGGAGVIERGAMTSVSDGTLKRRPAPSLDSVRTRLTRQLPVQLTRNARPAVAEGGTVIAAGVSPFTSAPGTARSVAIGRNVSANALGAVVGGLSGARLGAPLSGTKSGARRSADASASTLHAGDLVVLHAVDASIDVDPQNRPLFRVTGQARVTMTASDGTVLTDAMVNDTIAIPPRTAIIGVQAGGDTAVTDGLAGWHDRSRVARLNARVAIGTGCALQVEGVVSEAQPAWLTAQELIVQATGVTTRFVAQARTVIVILAGSDAPTPDDVTLELDGATRRADRNGKVHAPRVVMAGDRAALIYDVVPSRGAALSVHVQPGGQWRLAGVLAGDADSASLAQTIALKGIAPLAGRLLMAADGAPVSVTWEAAPTPSLPIGARPGTARQKTAGTAQRKTTSRERAARKTARQKGAVRTSIVEKAGVKKAGLKKTGLKKAEVKKADVKKTGLKKTAAGKRGVKKSVKQGVKQATKHTARRAAPKKIAAKTGRNVTAKSSTTRRGGARNAR